LTVNKGTLTTAGGGLVVGGAMTINMGATDLLTFNTGGINMTFGRLVLGGAGAGATNILSAGASTLTLNGSTAPLMTRNANGAFTAGTSTVVMNSPATLALTSGTFLTTNAFNNLTISMAGQTGTLGANITVNNTLLVSAGTLSNNNFAITSDGASTFQVNDGATFAMTGTSTFPPTAGGTSFSTYTFQCGAYPTCSTVSYRQTTNPLTITNPASGYGHLDLAPAGTATQRFAAGTYTINGDLIVGNATNATTADAATNSAILDVNGGVNIKANGTLQAHASNAFTVARDWTNNGTFTHNSGTVTFDSTNASTIGGSSTTVFRNLTLTKGAAVAVTASAAFTVANTLTISNASTTLADGGFTITAQGNVANSGTHSGAGKIYLNGGAAAHTLSGTGTYGNLQLDDAFGATLSASPLVSGTLTFTTGNLTTGAANTLTIGSGGSVSGAGTSKHVVGNLARSYSATTSFTYTVGDGTNYTPVTVTFTGAATGSLTATVTNTDHPRTTAGFSGITSTKSINRYWTLKTSTITGTYTATYAYVAGDIDGGANGVTVLGTSLPFVIVRRGSTCSGSGGARTCSSWAPTTPSGVSTTTTASASGIAISNGDPEADFVVGETGISSQSRERQFIYTRELY
jgi:hypothetical protein